MLEALINIFIAFILLCGVSYASVVFWVLVCLKCKDEDEE